MTKGAEVTKQSGIKDGSQRTSASKNLAPKGLAGFAAVLGLVLLTAAPASAADQYVGPANCGSYLANVQSVTTGISEHYHFANSGAVQSSHWGTGGYHISAKFNNLHHAFVYASAISSSSRFCDY